MEDVRISTEVGDAVIGVWRRFRFMRSFEVGFARTSRGTGWNGIGIRKDESREREWDVPNNNRVS